VKLHVPFSALPSLQKLSVKVGVVAFENQLIFLF
jgi:hypothetical protein